MTRATWQSKDDAGAFINPNLALGQSSLAFYLCVPAALCPAAMCL